MAIISDKIVQLMNYRIEQEEASSRLYKAMAVWLDFHGFSGAAKVWYRYSEEELVHKEWAYQYLLDLNIKPTTPSLEKPQNDYKGLANIVALSLKHEIEVTDQCKALATAAHTEGDFMTLELAMRYLKEQVEELSKTQAWVDKLNSYGDDKIALRLLDNEMAESVN